MVMRRSLYTLCKTALVALFYGWASPAETHLAVGRPVTLEPAANPRYPGTGGPATLTDGETDKENFGSGEWLGFEGVDVEVTVELGRPQPVHSIAVDVLQTTPPAIFLPVSVDIAVSENGTNFRTIATLQPKGVETDEGPLIERVAATGLDLEVQAVRVRAANGGRVPAWHRAPNALRWIFISEILVNPGAEPESPWTMLPGYRAGDSRWAPAAITAMLRQAGADSDARNSHCARLAEILSTPETTPDARRFCCDQLAVFGRADHIPVLAPLLTDPDLAAPAAAAIAALGGDAAAAALARSLNEAPRACQAAILNAAVPLHAPDLGRQAGSLLGSGDAGVAAAALAVVSHLPPATALDILENAAADPEGIPARRLQDALLVLATAPGTDAETAERVVGLCRRLVLEDHSSPFHVAALAPALRRGDPSAVDALCAALSAPDTVPGRTALSLLRTTVAEGAAAPFLARFHDLPTVARRIVLDAADPAVPGLRQAALTALQTTDSALQVAALHVLGTGGDAAVVTALAPHLAASDEAVSNAARDALTGLTGNGIDDALGAAAATAPPAARPGLADVLAARGVIQAVPILLSWTTAADRTTRKAAWSALGQLATDDDIPGMLAHVLEGTPENTLPEALASFTQAASRGGPAAAVGACTRIIETTLPGSTPDERALAALGQLQQPDGLPVLLSALQHEHPGRSMAAARALRGWPDTVPVDPLLAKARAADRDTVRRFALQGALDLLQRHRMSCSVEEVSRRLELAATQAREPDEWRLITSLAATAPTPSVLDLVAAQLTRDTIRAEAENALLALAPNTWPIAPLRTLDLLRQLADASRTEAIRTAADALSTRLLDALGRPTLERLAATPWTPLLHGDSLDGWQIVNGAATAWQRHNGLLTATAGGGGWLATTREFTDYLIDVEFRLPPEGNSGLFLHPPLDGNPAFEGVEIQILDDAAPTYARLSPAQYCGSIYGIAAAEPRVSGPAGLWQRLTVLCRGPRVYVWLNHVHVAAANLDDHLDKADRIPGVRRRSGFIGLQNEHGPIDFRNLRIKDLR